MKKYPTEGLEKNTVISIEGTPGASFKQAANALLLDMQRRLNAGELRGLSITAADKNNNTLFAQAT